MATVTQAQLDARPDMFRADALNLDAQLWEKRSTGQYFIYIPSNQKLRKFAQDGHSDFESTLKAIHDAMLLRDIINALPILPREKQELRARLHSGNLPAEADLPE